MSSNSGRTSRLTVAGTLALVTGAGGWLGSRLVRLLIDGNPEIPALATMPDRTIRGLVLPGDQPPALERLGERCERVEGDITHLPSLDSFFRGAEGATLFHCAGVIHPSRGVRQLYDVNVGGTRNLLAGAKAAGVRRFIHVSSNSPFGFNRSRDHLFDEHSPYRPYQGYGRSKMLAEQLVRNAEPALETVIVRSPWFYGTDQPRRQTLFFEMIKNGRVPLVGDGNNLRSMAYVDNICQGMMLCERTAAARGQAYWVADRRPYSMNEILETVERVMENDFRLTVAHRRLRLPGAVGDLAVVADRLLQGLGLYHQKIHVLSEMNKSIACRIDKAERELGYDPQIALEEGMRRSLQWLFDTGIRLA